MDRDLVFRSVNAAQCEMFLKLNRPLVLPVVSSHSLFDIEANENRGFILPCHL